MLLSEYIKGLQLFLEKHGDMIAVYAVDDEGNDFSEVHSNGTLGYYDGDDFYSEDPTSDLGKEDAEYVEKACCVN